MEFRSSRHHGVLVYAISGYLKDDAKAYEFVSHIRERIAAGNKKIVIDLGGVQPIDSSGIGILATAVTSASEAEVTLHFASIPPKVEQILTIVGLMQVLKTHPTLEAALESLTEE